MDSPFPEFMPSDRDQRKQLVRDMHRRSTEKERQRVARIEAREEAEILDTTDRAFGERLVHSRSYSPECPGFGSGVPGSAGRWVMREGKLVRT